MSNLLEAARLRPEVVASFMGAHLDSGRGLRIGESSVVSRFDHLVKVGWRGTVIVLTNSEPDRVLHLDVFHDPSDTPKARSALSDLVRATFRSEFPEEHEPDIDVRTSLTRVQIRSALSSSLYQAIPFFVAAVEDYLTAHGVGLRKVERLTHLRRPTKNAGSRANVTKSSFSGHRRQAGLLQTAFSLGSIQSVTELLEAMDPRIRRRPSLAELSAAHGGLSILISKMIAEGEVKLTLWGEYQLTKTGIELLEYTRVHAKELEAEYRQMLRKSGVDTTYEQIASRQRSQVNSEISDRGRIIRLGHGEWAGNIAIAETVLTAKTNTVLRGDSGLVITRDDIHVYRRQQKVPQDILLLIDASTSMRGKRFRAAVRLAEYLVLTSRERVGVVIFQNRSAQVATGFTRNHSILQRGLRTVQTGGLTPLADGIAQGVRLIKVSRAKNPLVFLITDGLPTVAITSSDPVQDSLAAAGIFSELKIRFTVIGLKPDADFLQRLATAGNGSAYIVDDLEHESLITIVRYERAERVK